MTVPARDPDNRNFDEFDPGWRWGNLRAVSLSVHVHLWPWHFGAEHEENVYDGRCSLSIGPITLGATYGIGNSSVHRFALSEAEAWERAMRAGGFPS